VILFDHIESLGIFDYFSRLDRVQLLDDARKTVLFYKFCVDIFDVATAFEVMSKIVLCQLQANRLEGGLIRQKVGTFVKYERAVEIKNKTAYLWH
jgi:hypothetical protein